MGSASTRTAAEIMAKGRQLAAEAEERLKLKAEAEKLEEEYVKCDALEVLNVKQVQLPLWPDDTRRMPNAILRCALFRVGQTREMLKMRTLIASVSGYEIRYNGETWNQHDADTLLQLIHFGRPHPLGQRVEFSAHAFLKSLGRGTDGRSHERLKNDIARLGSGWVEVTSVKEGKTFAGSFFSRLARDEHESNYVIYLNPDLLKLYQKGWTEVDFKTRLSLGRNDIAKWAHWFYSSYEDPYGISIKAIHRFCGSGAILKVFRQKLKLAIKKLVEVGILKSWSYDSKFDKIHVEIQPKLHIKKARATRYREHVLGDTKTRVARYRDTC